MANEKDMPVGFDLALSLTVNFAHKRAGRIQIIQPASFCLGRNRFRDAMCAEYNRCTIGNFVQFLDENRAFFLQPVDNIFIVDDLVSDINGRAISLDGLFNNLE